jgi:hypothetical protein
MENIGVNSQEKRKFHASDWIRLTGTVLSFLAFGFSLYTLNFNSEKQRELKTLDLMANFQERYDEIMWETKDRVETNHNAKDWYTRFWNLQLEQYEYWKKGYISDETYEYWMAHRRHSFNENNNPFINKPEVTITYKEGWEYSSKHLVLSEHRMGFRKFMESIFRPTIPISDIFKANDIKTDRV